MEKCVCTNPGFCPIFQQEMTENPPNWQWCQNATTKDREKYKENCDKKHKRYSKGPWFLVENLSTKFVTTANLVEDCKNFLVPKLAKEKLRGIIGIPRSGMVPAGTCATMLNIPMCMVHNGEIITMNNSSANGGLRMKKHKEVDGHYLLIDDTCSSGGSIRNALNMINEKDRSKIKTCAVYSNPELLDVVDIYGLSMHHPYLLEWNLFNSAYMNLSYLDFDGILSPDVPFSFASNEDSYIKYITEVEPIYHRLPRMYSCKAIVTARLDKYRDITEKWLAKHGVLYDELHMFPSERERDRNANHIIEASNFKSSIYKKGNVSIFIESNEHEAELIHKNTNKLVLCPDKEKVWVYRG